MNTLLFSPCLFMFHEYLLSNIKLFNLILTKKTNNSDKFNYHTPYTYDGFGYFNYLN